MNSHSHIDKKEFWNIKILPWEQKNYNGGALWGSAIRWRQKLFLELARPYLKGATVFEAGCGSGLLLQDLFSCGIKSYVGCDISPAGIREARTRAAQLGLAAKTEFHESSVLETSKVIADVSFSLGLWDWLTDEEIEKSLKSVIAQKVLHSFSERRSSVSQLLHRAYVYSAYGHKNMSYTPEYRTVEELSKIMKRAGVSQTSVRRDNRMSFSTFIHNLG